MNCQQCRQLLNAYLDDELDLQSAIQIEEHLPGCAECQKALDAARAVRAAVAQPANYYPASVALRDRVAQSIRHDTPRRISWWRSPTGLSGLAAGLVLMISAIALLVPSGGSRGQIDELVGSHVRSLEANHLLDVESTDQHTVKPWFGGKIDFSPPVIDLANEGFPLVGGRLDYLNHQKVAALIYHRNQHVINLFIWPGDASVTSDSKQGFNLIRFECKGMTCWAVSDLNASELQQFADLFKAQKAASTRF